MPKFRYVGPVDQIETILDGKVCTVARGETVDVTAHTAKKLTTEIWEPVKPSKKKTSDSEETG